MEKKRPILITGSHRSGSTWVGKTLAFSDEVGYIFEPFKTGINHRPGICSAVFDNWFTYISNENESYYYPYLLMTLNYKYHLIEEFMKIISDKPISVRTIKDFAKMVRDFGSFKKYKILNARPLLKDPLALFSAEWLAKTFDMDVVVLIRHPAAFVSSIKRLNWTHPFSHFLNQHLLMRDHLFPFEAEIIDFSNEEKNIVEQGILLWKLTHYMIRKYMQQHKNWIFVRHEDLSANPLEGFQKLFEGLQLKYTEKVDRKIVRYTSSSNPSEAPLGRSTFKRDSLSNITNWKKRLDQNEIKKIRDKSGELSAFFYSDQEW